MVYYYESVMNGTDINYSSCGATLIDKDYVITAAHCIGTKNASDITLTAGSHNLESIMEIDERQRRTVETIHVHPQFDSVSMLNDIAVLRVSTSFTFNTYVQPACLPGGEPEPGDEVVIIGWGAEIEDGPTKAILKQAYTEVVDHCDSWWAQADSSKQICVADAFDGNKPCPGDSGGPILKQYQGQYVVSGIISYGLDCDPENTQETPDVYTRVGAYKAWIKSIIERTITNTHD
jgi:secreted trypsin-like serine protease